MEILKGEIIPIMLMENKIIYRWNDCTYTQWRDSFHEVSTLGKVAKRGQMDGMEI